MKNPGMSFKPPSHPPGTASGAGPGEVFIARGERTDPARRNRRVPYKLYAPATDGTGKAGDLPVIVWSHGLGGSADGAAFLARHIAGSGYIVLHIQHAGTDSGLWQGKPGHPWDNIRAARIPRRASLDRFRDVSFMIDRLPDILAAHPAAERRADLSRIGMSGHSFGAITTQVAAGQMLGRGRRLYSLREPRIAAAIAYSPSPAYNRDEDPVRIYGGIAVPLLCMTGTDDGSPVSGRDYTHRLPIYEHAGSPEKHLLVLEDGDHMVFAGSRGQLGENPKRAAHEDIVKTAALAFWDAYLKNDAAAKSWLADGGFAAWLNGEGRYEFVKKEEKKP